MQKWIVGAVMALGLVGAPARVAYADTHGAALAAITLAQNVLTNPCGGSDVCFGTGNAQDAYIVTDGAKRIKINFAGTQIDPLVDNTISFGQSGKTFKDATFTGTVTAGTFSGTFSGPGAFTFINVDHGTVTANTQPTVDTTVTWNSGAVTFTANKTNVTDTASASASLLEDWQVGGSSKASVRKDGLVSALGLSAGTSGVATPFVNATHGTVTANTQPTWNGTVTWNSGAVSFFGIKLDVTNTASAATSKLIDLQVGGVTQFNVTRAGNVTSTGTYSGTTITGSLIASTADVQTGATGRYLIDNRLILSASATGKAVIANWNGDAGVSIDMTTDGTAFFKTRGDADTAIVKANQVVTTGTATFGGATTTTQATAGNAVQTLISTATNDDPTETVVQNRVATTDATVTTIATIAIPATTTLGFDGYVVARRTGGAAGTDEDGAYYGVGAVFKNVAGTATQIGSTTLTVFGESQAGWTVTVSASGGNALVQVTGAVDNNVTWHVTLRTHKVGS